MLRISVGGFKRPVPTYQSDSKGSYAQHLEASAPSSPGSAGRSGDGEFTKPGGELDIQKLLATYLMTPTYPSDNEHSRMAKQTGSRGPERSNSPQLDTSSSSTLKFRDYRPAVWKPAPVTVDPTDSETDRDLASGLKHSSIRILPRYREPACAGSDTDAPAPFDALKSPVPRPCAPVTPSGQPRVLWRMHSPTSPEDEVPMSELQMPASTGRALRVSERLDRIKRPAAGKGASGYRGVSWHSNRWRAAITHRGKLHHLGAYRTTHEAAQVYDRAALKMKGPQTRTNFPASTYGYVWDDIDARPRERAPARKRRSPDNPPCESPGASGSPPSDAPPMQRAAKRQRAKAGEGAEVDGMAMDVEADFEVLPKAVQVANRAERAKRRAAAAGGLQVDGSSAAPAMLGRLGQLPPIPEVAEPEPDRPSHGSPTTSTTPSEPSTGRARHRSARKKASPVRSHLC